MKYKFDHDWFSFNIHNLKLIFSRWNVDRPIDILEIGTFEGRSTFWFLDNVNCNVTTIDHWNGGRDHYDENMKPIEAINFSQVKTNFERNCNFCDRLDHLRVLEKESYDALIQLYLEGAKFDFLFVDGSHLAKDVNSDLVMSWRLMRPDSVIYCDDYWWGFSDWRVFHSPKLGIDSFINTYQNELTVLDVTDLRINSMVLLKKV